ncbi:hypothetical protein NP493_2001g00007 [Ridgeia piscesae]|uniref:Chitin-binding type-2 domain-containing protein n=1 Tax=Ridgeia piscesae TaxID=27915 RepID=A0AAD9N6P6_RIDPI|nr:hypothetical protein NP493_2001g00007 [Ridgeia piscesae]
MAVLVIASVCSLLVLTADAVPWNELAAFPDKTPWSDWIPVKFNLTERWAMPASTCFEGHLDGDGNRIENYYDFDAQDKCPLCKGAKSTPGYAADPNNCAMFYSCVKWGGVWTPYHMSCPKCQFWDQEELTCVQVYDDPICYPPTTTLAPNATTTTPPPPPPTAGR